MTPFTPGIVRPVVPPEPVFSPSALEFRSGPHDTPNRPRFDFFWGRNAIFTGLRALGIQPGETVLVPAYLCIAAIEPIEYLGARVEFYATRRDCSPDWLDLEAKIQRGARAVLAVHYFGFPCDMERFCALRKQKDLILVEDCAHVLDGVPTSHPLGAVGDFSIFSPRKYLPIFDGGTLRFNRPVPAYRFRFQTESPLFTLRVAKNLFERRKPSTELAVRSTAASGPNETKPKSRQPVSLAQAGKPLHVYPNSATFLPWMADFPMSRISRHLLPHFPLSSIASKRRANYRGLLERLSRIKGVRPLFEQLDPGVVPWVMPVTIGEQADAHTVLRALGIPAVTWDGVRHPRISAQEFPDADFLYKHLVFLPIHQDLEPAHLDLIADALATVCRVGCSPLPG